MKSSLKSILCKISSAMNLPIYLGPFGKNKIIVLMYHGIIKSYSQNPLKDIYGYHISEKEFEDQMAYLSQHCNVIKVSEAIADGKISHQKKTVVITFDDGYRNNYTNAFPVLLKYNLPALFSIPTDFIVNRKPLWNDVLEYAVTITNKKSVHIIWENIDLDFKLDTTTDKIEFIKWLLLRCVEIIQEKREQFISHVLKELDVSLDNNRILENPDYEPLSLQEIKIMSDSKLTEFASHSVHHYALSRLSKGILINELVNSKSDIEYMTGQSCKYLCIPGGFFDKTIIDVILDAGFEKIFSSERKEVHHMNMFNVIGRYCITRSINMPIFVDIVHGPIHRVYYLLNFKK